mmetsp:Transcript_29233/g.45427  ORF Transcript_29233/g.45427 Transcript_29233/m.45427 type:complete len:86 (-) Transcript_29233:207-464(-)
MAFMVAEDIGQENMLKVIEDCVGPTLIELAHGMHESSYGTGVENDGDDEDMDRDSDGNSSARHNDLAVENFTHVIDDWNSWDRMW